MSRSIDFAVDDHPDGDDEKAPVHWIVAISDDCDECGDLRVTLSFEERGTARDPLVAHLATATARRLRGSLADALREIGEDPGA